MTWGSHFCDSDGPLRAYRGERHLDMLLDARRTHSVLSGNGAALATRQEARGRSSGRRSNSPDSSRSCGRAISRSGEGDGVPIPWPCPWGLTLAWSTATCKRMKKSARRRRKRMAPGAYRLVDHSRPRPRARHSQVSRLERGTAGSLLPSGTAPRSEPLVVVFVEGGGQPDHPLARYRRCVDVVGQPPRLSSVKGIGISDLS